MKVALLITLLLAACASDPPPAGLMVPCGVRTLPPQPPKSGTRNISNIVAWANQLQLAREATDRTLSDCADRHSQLVKWVKEH